jgi:hypothetical protein
MEETQLDGTSTEIKDPKAVLDALDRAKKEAKQFRLEREDLEKKFNEVSDSASTLKSKYINQMINRHLADLGIPNAERLMKYIKSDSLILNEDLELEGLEEQIESIKKDFPELFDPKLLVGGKVNSAQSTPVSTRLSASEMQARMVLGR